MALHPYLRAVLSDLICACDGKLCTAVQKFLLFVYNWYFVVESLYTMEHYIPWCIRLFSILISTAMFLDVYTLWYMMYISRHIIYVCLYWQLFS